MGNIIDITSRITNELPIVKITDSLVVTVNNRKNTVLNMQAMVQETQKKAEAGDGTFNEIEMMEKSLEMLVGGKAAKEIAELDLPLPEYKLVYQAVMAAATGSSMEEVESRFQKSEEK